MADSGLKKIDRSIFQDWDHIIRGEINADLLVLGSSRGAVGYDPSVLEEQLGLSSFNLSFNAGSYNLQEVKLEAYVENNEPPKMIIHNLDLAHFVSSKEVPERYQFLPFLENKYLREELNSIDPHFGRHAWVTLLKYNHYKPLLVKGIFSFFGKSYSIYPTEKGFTPYDKNFERDVNNLKRLELENLKPLNISRYRDGLNHTRFFLQKKIPLQKKVFLVWAPELKERAIISSPLRKLIIAEIHNITSDLPNVHFLDFSQDEMSGNPEFFYDTFHLNKAGATYFTYKLSSEISRILEN
ncbi:hypothetical protein [Salinimicrobium sediminilitoris]|uniref:hypothetical protein n=1 Tax=Salinimicrobium sediminilitoris TaxID=2876715 RepID=UPI001E341CB5|nr:hypothetical protein [Salinimicrobium sediminilitoris]MCC8358508.1 hypothetical protein [Salinimicrobium sediminilitoris]